jgi:hypothetical protein
MTETGIVYPPVLTGDIFVIPNEPVIEYKGKKGTYFSYDANEMTLQVCITNKENNNWIDNNYEKLKYSISQGWFPFKLFYNKKEGDIITLYNGDQKLELKIQQSKYKYGPEKFEECIIRLLKGKLRRITFIDRKVNNINNQTNFT